MTSDERDAATRRGFLRCCSLGAVAMLAGAPRALAQPAPASAGPPEPRLIEDLVAANRILADQGVVDGYGHVSMRHEKDPSRYFMAQSRAPELVSAGDILEYDLDSAAVDPRGRPLFLERFIHGEIYKVRPDVKAVVHHHSPSVIPFGVSGVPLRPLYHMSAFLIESVPVFEIRDAGGMTDMLIRNGTLGAALAKTLGERPMVLMRGHGAVVVGPTIVHAVARSIYGEMNARLQAQALALGGANVKYLDAEEARKADASIQGTYARPWELWKRKALAR
jgi:ribulose-5-phosphate 4-epimerase/fuculose-1-phosphate aldolase